MEFNTFSWELMGLPFLFSALTAVIAGWVVRALYLRFSWVDDPKKTNHAKVVHQYPVPRGGGLVVMLGLFVGTLAFLSPDKHLVGILAGVFLLTVVGVIDDVLDIHPFWRLAAGLLAGLLVVGVGIGIAYVTNPFGNGVIHLDMPQLQFWLLGKWRSIWILADIFALIWIVWCMNMLNWSKGVDGQLPGIVVIAALVIGLLSFRFVDDVTQWPVITLAGATAGAFFGLLLWNVYPQRLMPGYGGGSLAGYLLAILSILSGAKLATLILVLAVPMMDGVYVVLKRIAQKKSPFWGDRNHLHHALMDLGWGKRRISGFYWFMTAWMGWIALQLNPDQKAFTILLIGLTIGGVGIWLRRLIIS
jgi:UDP-GlcNAc:undecaprenyl-phosphate GlcNAc-1-phosphate transferase